MGQVTLTFNGRTYSVGCGDGEEERLRALGAHVRDKLERLVREFGQAGEARLFLLTALVIADELFEARSERDLAASTAAAAVLREMADRARPETAEDADTSDVDLEPPSPASAARVLDDVDESASDPSRDSVEAEASPDALEEPQDLTSEADEESIETLPLPESSAQKPPGEDALRPAISALQAAINRSAQAAVETAQRERRERKGHL